MRPCEGDCVERERASPHRPTNRELRTDGTASADPMMTKMDLAIERLEKSGPFLGFSGHASRVRIVI